MVSVASEGRIEGEVETGNADLPGQILHHHHYQQYHHYWWHPLAPHYYSSTRISPKVSKIEDQVTFPDQFWFQLWFIEEEGLWSPE